MKPRIFCSINFTGVFWKFVAAIIGIIDHLICRLFIIYKPVMKRLIAFSLFTTVFCIACCAQEREKIAPSGFDSLRLEIPHGKIDTITYPSKTVGTNRRSLIYTPPDFSSKKKYPVLYLLHGIGGDEKEWLK